MSDNLHGKPDALRAVKYRLLFIFLLLPSVLVVAILFRWIWAVGLESRLSNLSLSLIYGGLIALFLAAFFVIGYMMRKRLRRAEDEAHHEITSAHTRSPH